MKASLVIRVANLQRTLTPLCEDVPNWMALGFELFERLGPFSPLEVPHDGDRPDAAR